MIGVEVQTNLIKDALTIISDRVRDSVTNIHTMVHHPSSTPFEILTLVKTKVSILVILVTLVFVFSKICMLSFE